MAEEMDDFAGRLADRLLEDHAADRPFRPFAADNGIVDLASAYAVQAALVTRMLEREATGPAGYKIGLTSARMQAMCGIDRPVAGVVLASRVHRAPASVRLSDFGHLGIEFEIGIRLGRDFDPGPRAVSVEEIAPAVDAVCPAIELVDDRRAQYNPLDALSLIADNSWNGGIVIGEFRRDWPDLAAVAATAERDGSVIDRGHGGDVMGHPFAPLAWLAGHLSAQGSPLKAGDVVLTGSIVPTRFPQAGEVYSFMLEGLGSVELRIEK